jgi:hypothetical protein
MSGGFPRYHMMAYDHITIILRAYYAHIETKQGFKAKEEHKNERCINYDGNQLPDDQHYKPFDWNEAVNAK